MQEDYFAPADLASLVIVLVGWTMAYVVIIRRSLIDRVCGMPLLPLCVNLSWEFIFGFVHPDKPPANVVNMLYFLFDLGIVYAYVRHGRSQWPAALPRWSFLPGSLAVLALAFAFVLSVTYQLNDWTGSYTGWGDNLLIFCAWLALLLRRQDTRGQSMYIVLPAWIGSVCLMPLEWHITGGNLILVFFYVGFIAIGPVYMLLLYRQFRNEGRNPWKVI